MPGAEVPAPMELLLGLEEVATSRQEVRLVPGRWVTEQHQVLALSVPAVSEQVLLVQRQPVPAQLLLAAVGQPTRLLAGFLLATAHQGSGTNRQDR